jgi:protocatechuate 3,4-dioxygenase beta subunit
VLVDQVMLIAAEPGLRVDMAFTSNGTTANVTATFPKNAQQRITFAALADANETGVDVSAGPAAAKDELAGVVVDPEGKPVAGAVVSFPSVTPDAIKPVTTGDDGIFRFPKFGDTWYVYLRVDKEGYAPRLLTDIPIGQGFTVHLYDNTRLKGQLLGPDDSPAANAKLKIVTAKATSRPRIMNPIPNLTVLAQADEQGRYDVPLEPGEYDISVTAASGVGRFQQVLIPSGQEIALSGKLISGVSLTLNAVDSVTHQPVAGVKFYMVEQRPGEISVSEETKRTTDAKGVARWEKLPPGPAGVEVATDDYCRWWIGKDGQQPGERGIDMLSIDLTDGMAAVTVQLEPAVQVSGQVVTPTGQPVAGAEVDIAGLSTGDARYARRTDAKGNYKLSFPVLNMTPSDKQKPASFAIVACDTKHRWANTATDWFTPKAGDKLQFTIKMTPGAKVRGRIVTPDGKPVARIEVHSQTDDQLDCYYYNPRALTDAQGRYVLGPLRSGQYSVYVSGDLAKVGDRNEPPQAALKVAEGDRLELGDIIYNGPAPSPPPEWYPNEYGWPLPLNPTTEPDDAGPWQHVDVVRPAK